MEEKKTPSQVMNVPNVLSLIRMALVPVCIAVILYIPLWCASLTGFSRVLVICLVPTLIFIVTSVTDLLDGKIARKYHLITDFGKFIDPLADKIMVFGILLAVLCTETYAPVRGILVWVAAIVLLRELGVTSLRLVVASRGVVVAASWWGKVKTCTQIAALVVILLEPALVYFAENPGDSYSLLADGHLLSYLAMAAMAVTTVGSGIDYLIKYWPYVSGKK